MNKTLFLSQNAEQDPADQPQPEARMREALGLRSDGSRVAPPPAHRPDRMPDHGAGNPRRHRFVQEGEVPVEVMQLRSAPSGPPRHRVDETALAAEKLAREQAERAFADATDRIRELKTKLGHAELARDEALTLAAERQVYIEALLAQPPPTPTPAPAPVASAPRKIAAPKSTAPRPRGRIPAPKPVKWWIKASSQND